MTDVIFSSFNVDNLQFERNLQPGTDEKTGNSITTPQLIFNYVDPEAPVAKMAADGAKRRARFVLQGPRMKTNPSNYRHPEGKYVKSGSLTYRENKKTGDRSYSISQTYDLENPEHVDWVQVNRTIQERLVNEWSNKEVKSWSKHTVTKNNMPNSVPCLIYQETEEDESGNVKFKEGSKPSCFFDFFEARTREGKIFGTRVRIHGSRTDLPKEKWIKLLSENAVEYTPYVSYMRSSLTGKDKFALKTQLDMIVIHDVTPFEGKTAGGFDRRVERMGVTAEDEARAKRIEAMLSGGGDSSSAADDSNHHDDQRSGSPVDSAVPGSNPNDW